jgi:hypothetical protein
VTFTRGTTATFVGSNGLIQTAAVNVPRLDFDPVTLAPRGLLIEEQRTNLLLWSEQFDNAGWTKAGATITANSTVAPTGTLTADLLTASAGLFSGAVAASPSPTISSATAYTLSAFVKKSNWRYVGLRFNTSVSGANEQVPFYDFDTDTLSNGGVSGATISRTLLGDGWVRLAMTFTSTSTAGTTQIWLTNASGGTLPAKAGGEAVFLWGAQLEAGAFATSYIPTVASQVTRSADVATMTGTNFSSWYNQSAGTFVVDASTVEANTANRSVYWASNAGNTDIVYGVAGTVRTLRVLAGGAEVASISAGTFTNNVPAKTAGAYRVNDFAASFNGGTVGTDTTGAVPTGIDRMALGGSTSLAAINQLNGHIRQIVYFNTRLSNAQLQALTV